MGWYNNSICVFTNPKRDPIIRKYLTGVEPLRNDGALGLVPLHLE